MKLTGPRLCSVFKFSHSSICNSFSRKNSYPCLQWQSARRYSYRMARTYEDALSHLSALQSNLAITSLFAPQAQAAVPASDSTESTTKKEDLNALAIPEMLAWLGRAGLSQEDLSRLKCIHVAGTKGKGSVCAYLTSILTNSSIRSAAGRVGTYTSPHLISVRERIMLDGEPISQELFTRYFFEVWDAMTSSGQADYLRQNSDAQLDEKLEAELQGPATKPFYFRFLTIMAFHVFLKEGVKSAVVECGIGGEYDSTNILPTEAVTATVVTQLGIDHVGMLGGTLPEIAWHKTGIAKPGRKCFTRKLENQLGREVMQVMSKRTEEKGAILIELDDETVEQWGGVGNDNADSLSGHFQKYNQALAKAAVEEHLRLCGSSHESLDRVILEGLRQARLKGRCETRIEGNITWFIDGAHTVDSLHEVARWYAEKMRSQTDVSRILIFNQQERDVRKLLSVLLDGNQFHKAIFTRNDLHPRTRDEPERDIAVQETASDAFKSTSPDANTTVSVSDNVTDAVNEARQHAASRPERTVVLVTGSLHLVGALLQILEPNAPR